MCDASTLLAKICSTYFMVVLTSSLLTKLPLLFLHTPPILSNIIGNDLFGNKSLPMNESVISEKEVKNHDHHE